MRTLTGEPKDRFLEANGLRLHYLDWGGQGQPWMLLFHGGSQTAHTWDFFADALRSRYHIIAPDMRGHGDSDWSPALDYSRETMLRDNEALVWHLGMDREGFVLMGMSMGGLNAIHLTSHHPEWVKGLILLDIAPGVDRGRGGAAQQYGAGLQEGVFEEFLAEAKRLFRRSSEEFITHSLRFALKELPDGRLTWKVDPRRADGEYVTRGTAALWEDVKAIRCPTLIVRGEVSRILTEEAARKMQSLIPGSRYVIVPGAGHNVQGDNPEGLEAVVRDFLKSAGL